MKNKIVGKIIHWESQHLFVGTPQFGKLMKLPIENDIEKFLFLRVLILVFVVHLSPQMLILLKC